MPCPSTGAMGGRGRPIYMPDRMVVLGALGAVGPVGLYGPLVQFRFCIRNYKALIENWSCRHTNSEGATTKAE